MIAWLGIDVQAQRRELIHAVHRLDDTWTNQAYATARTRSRGGVARRLQRNIGDGTAAVGAEGRVTWVVGMTGTHFWPRIPQ
jgi:hypothetical protein